ncbi:hypothetical protein PQR71_12040 [Paraburkholderia fungorum]|uniref:hypothetical protein n=1 Tax=Paraburkholderia fungorum TaxID=134537 RepID=UPI0038B80098
MEAQPNEISLIWTNFKGQLVPTFRDSSGALIEPICTYLDECAQTSQASPRKTETGRRKIRSITYALLGYHRFLAANGQVFATSTDALLEKFANDAFALTRGNPRSRGHEYQAEETTNVKLRYIYDALEKCQQNGLLPEGTIGWQKCKVRSSLPDFKKAETGFNSRPENKYPKLFENTGGLTEIDEGQYWMTDEDVRLIDLRFREAENRHKRERDCLLLRLGEATGWRRGSLNSLLTTQFSRYELNAQSKYDAFSIRPVSQKGHRRYVYQLSWELANDIARYIEDDRTALMSELGIDEDVAQRRVFLSVTNGKPIVNRTVTDIFSAALRELGRPKGASSHAMKRRKGQSTMEEEYDYRKRNNLPVDRVSMENAVMQVLGHGTREAQRAYVRLHRVKRAQTAEDKLRDKIQELEARCAALARLAEQRAETVRELLEKSGTDL